MDYRIHVEYFSGNWAQMKDINVGTIHALQGAERNVIIFSSVYDSGKNGKSYFLIRSKYAEYSGFNSKRCFYCLWG